MKKNRKRYFMTADLNNIIRVEYATKKELIALMKDSKNSSYGNINGFTDNYFHAVAVESKQFWDLSEEETEAEIATNIRSIERSRNINIVNENSECYVVYGAIDINEYGVVTASETIADNIDISITEITEEEVEEIAEAERKIRNKLAEEAEAFEAEIAEVEATATAEAEEAIEAEEAEQAEAMTASEISEAKKAIDDYSFYHNACTVKTVRKHFLTAIAEQAEETAEHVKRYRNNVVKVCDMIIAEQAEQKKLNKTKAVVTGVTAIYDFNADTIDYSVNYSNNTVRDYATKTATASAFMATAKSFTIEATKNNDSLTKAYVCYYATEEEAEEAEENNFNAILKAKAEAKRNNDSALNWKKYDYVNRNTTADIFIVHDVRRKTGTAEEQAEEEIERIKRMTEEAKQRKADYEQRKIVIEQAKQAEAEIAEAIEATEETEILKKLAEQAEEEATKAIQNNLFNTARNLKKLAEQATEKASTRSEATAEQAEIIAIEEAIEEAETMRYYAEASATAEEIEAIEAEIERLRNRKQKKLQLKDNNDFIEIAEAKEAEIAKAVEATTEAEALKKLAEEAEEIANIRLNKQLYKVERF